MYETCSMTLLDPRTLNTETSDLSLGVGQNHDHEDHRKDAFNDENEAKQVDFSW